MSFPPTYADARRVASRHQVRQVARRVSADLQRGPRTASSNEMTADVLWAFADAFWTPPGGTGRVAGMRGLRGLAKRLKQLGKMFTRAPRLWQDFKRLVGVESLKDLPGILRDLAEKGKSVLKGVFKKAFNTFPLSMFKIKGAGVNDFLKKLTDRVPGLNDALGKVKGGADQLGDFLRKHAPNLSKILIAAVFIFIWMNVLEFEWNFSDIAKALVGGISLGELLATLPGSAIGMLMNVLGLGTFTLLPVALFARIMWLVAKGYVVWDGRWFKLDERALQADGYSIA